MGEGGTGCCIWDRLEGSSTQDMAISSVLRLVR